MNKTLFWILISLGIILVVLAGSFAYITYTKGEATTEKPAIYLYPEIDSQISVKLNINGQLIKDIPSYNNGWDVYVTKEGIIENKYDYLFYENTLNNLELPEEGWIISKKELDNWFETKLPQLGLNNKEKTQFKEYWIPRLTNSNYYEIKLLDIDFLNENMGLIISPQPDTEIRIIFSFKEVNKPYSLEEPLIITPIRKGFTVVEWGGILLE